MKIKKTVPVYMVMTNTDLTEGKGMEYARWHCLSKSTAERVGDGKYVMGQDCPIIEGVVLEVEDEKFSGVYGRICLTPPSKEDVLQDQIEAEMKQAKEAKEKALKKAKDLGLSDEDIEALKG